MQLNSYDVLVEDRHIWDLLSRLSVSFVKVFHEFSGTENVIQVERPCQSREVVVYVPLQLIVLIAG